MHHNSWDDEELSISSYPSFPLFLCIPVSFYHPGSCLHPCLVQWKETTSLASDEHSSSSSGFSTDKRRARVPPLWFGLKVKKSPCFTVNSSLLSCQTKQQSHKKNQVFKVTRMPKFYLKLISSLVWLQGLNKRQTCPNLVFQACNYQCGLEHHRSGEFVHLLCRVPVMRVLKHNSL